MAQGPGPHLSTLVQQLLSALAQYGGLVALDAWRLLCAEGPFPILSRRDFADLLRGLAERQVLVQDARGLLMHGPLGERLTGHYSFYAAFASDEEFRLVSGSRTLGSLPISRPLEPGSYLIFAGRRWRVLSLDRDKKSIEVSPDRAGRAPLFDGMGGKVHDRVREEMRILLAEESPVPFLDPGAADLLSEARTNFRRLRLDQTSIVEMGSELGIFLWKGDWIQDTVALMLRTRGMDALNTGLFVSVRETTADAISEVFRDLVANSPTESELMAHVVNQIQEKWDFLLTETLLARNYASHNLDIEGALGAIRERSSLAAKLGMDNLEPVLGEPVQSPSGLLSELAPAAPAN